MRAVHSDGGTVKWWPTWKLTCQELGTVSFGWRIKSKACAIKSLLWEARVSDPLRPHLVLVVEVQVRALNARPVTCGTCSA